MNARHASQVVVWRGGQAKRSNLVGLRLRFQCSIRALFSMKISGFCCPANDAHGYRIRKDSYTSGTLSEARHHYDTPSWQVIEELAGISTNANRQFGWGL